MKRTAIIGLISVAMLFLTACSGKEQVDYDVTEVITTDEAVQTTEQASGEGDTSQASSASTSDWQVPEKLDEKITGEEKDVTIYADITVPDAYKKCQVVELIRDDFTDEDIVSMVETVFDEGSYFLCMPSWPCTSEYYAEVHPKLTYMRDSLPDEGNALIEINQTISRYEQYQQEASEFDYQEETDGTLRFYSSSNGEFVEKECCEIVGTIDGVYYTLLFEKSKGACYAWLFKYGMNEDTREVSSDNIDVKLMGNTCIYTEEEATDIAVEYIEKLGINDMIPVHVNHIVRREDVNGYSVYFGRSYENYHLTYTTDNFTINRYSYITEEEADDFAGYTTMECIRIEIGDEGVRGFELSSPMKQGEIMTENAVLLPWDSVNKVACETLSKAADDQGKTIVIKQIELGYGIEKKDNRVAIVPVWYYFDINAVDDSYRYTKTSILEINALDGSIIKGVPEGQ